MGTRVSRRQNTKHASSRKGFITGGAKTKLRPRPRSRIERIIRGEKV